MHDFFKRNYGFSDYQIAQLAHLTKTILSEISKLFIMCLFFWHELDIYAVSIIILLLMRTSTGGLHCKTYFTCLASSSLYMLLCIKVFPFIPVPLSLQLFSLICCMIINYKLGPVTSEIHFPLSEKRIKKGRLRAAFIIFIFSIILYVIPGCKYIPACFWIIIVHSLQLIYAKIRRKEKKNEAEIN